MTRKLKPKAGKLDAQYESIFGDVSRIIETARRSAVRSVNTVMTAAYWLIGHRIVEFEQAGKKRAEYGTALIERLAADLSQRFGRGFSRQNIQQMRLFYLFYPPDQIRQTLSGEFMQVRRQAICQTPSGESEGKGVRTLFLFARPIAAENPDNRRSAELGPATENRYRFRCKTKY